MTYRHRSPRFPRRSLYLVWPTCRGLWTSCTQKLAGSHQRLREPSILGKKPGSADTCDRCKKEAQNWKPNVTMCACFSRWGVCLIVCCVVLLVVVCNLLGLVLGPPGLKSKADPTKRSCTANCGGTFLMMWVLELIFSNCFTLWALFLISDPDVVAGVQVSASSSAGCSWLLCCCCSCWAGTFTLCSVSPGTTDNC